MKKSLAHRLKRKIMKLKKRRVYERLFKIILVIIALVLIYLILKGYLFRSCIHSVVIGILLTLSFLLRYLIRPKEESMKMTVVLAVVTVLYWIFALVECFT